MSALLPSESELFSDFPLISNPTVRDAAHSTFRVASFNSLAECYACSQSFPSVDSGLLKWNVREPKLLYILERLAAAETELICLQEVDAKHVESFWQPAFDSRGYEMRYLQRPGGKQDGCLLAWKVDRWMYESSKELSFDDAVDESVAVASQYRQRNVALLVTLNPRISGRHRILVVCAHLFWNPARDDVKLLQAGVLVHAIEDIRASCPADTRPSVVLCGDFNSTPGSAVYRLLTEGRGCLSRGFASDLMAREGGGDYAKRVMSGSAAVEAPKFMCDAMLPKMCRWLRILGYDTIIETPEEEAIRASSRAIPVADRAFADGRYLLTASRSLMQRKGCRAAFFINSRHISHLEKSLVDLCRLLNLRPNADDLLTRCVICNGMIKIVEKTDVTTLHEIREREVCPARLLDDGQTQLYCCNGCKQVYWWSQHAGSSAARAMTVANHLHALVHEGVMRAADATTAKGEVSPPGDRSPRDDEKESEYEQNHEQDDETDEAPAGVRQTDILSVLLRGEVLEHKLELESAYEIPYTPPAVGIEEVKERVHVEDERATNVTAGFIGTLDYIMHTKELKTIAVAELPTVRSLAIDSEGLLPSSSWPSDHLCLVADFEWKEK